MKRTVELGYTECFAIDVKTSNVDYFIKYSDYEFFIFAFSLKDIFKVAVTNYAKNSSASSFVMFNIISIVCHTICIIQIC